MRRDRFQIRGRSPYQPTAASVARSNSKRVPLSKRVRGKRTRGGQLNERLPFVPPEDWHEPVEESHSYRFVLQEPGPGFRHVLTPDEVSQRLAELPAEFLAPLDVIQFSRMTRKKQSFPCYGMQWGSTLYLYPIEEELVEYYHQPPRPSQVNEANMYGGRWCQESSNLWKLVWTDQAIKDFYLHNILIHELGHLVDDRNSRAVDRERFAEWFAIRYGYRAVRNQLSTTRRPVRRRHHSQH
jgi:hypothetical protein